MSFGLLSFMVVLIIGNKSIVFILFYCCCWCFGLVQSSRCVKICLLELSLLNECVNIIRIPIKVLMITAPMWHLHIGTVPKRNNRSFVCRLNTFSSKFHIESHSFKTCIACQKAVAFQIIYVKRSRLLVDSRVLVACCFNKLLLSSPTLLCRRQGRS